MKTDSFLTENNWSWGTLFNEKFKEEIPRYMIKHQVRPGMTGWAQVCGFRGDTSIEGRIEHDILKGLL